MQREQRFIRLILDIRVVKLFIRCHIVNLRSNNRNMKHRNRLSQSHLSQLGSHEITNVYTAQFEKELRAVVGRFTLRKSYHAMKINYILIY